MRILIIEDENIAANDLVEIIKKVKPTVSFIKVLTSVDEAILFLKENSDFDLIFSDIQLGDGNCFEIFEQVKISVPIVFCTAYNQYMLNAFKTNGIDYILKPFDAIQIEKAIQKFEMLTSPQTNYIDRIINLFHDNRNRTEKSFIIFYKEKIIPIDFNEIALIFLKQNIVSVITFQNKIYKTNQTLEEIEKQLDNRFFRVNRQFFIHRKAVKDVSKLFNRKLLLNLTIGLDTEITISKEKYAAFLDWLRSV